MYKKYDYFSDTKKNSNITIIVNFKCNSCPEKRGELNIIFFRAKAFTKSQIHTETIIDLHRLIQKNDVLCTH